MPAHHKKMAVSCCQPVISLLHWNHDQSACGTVLRIIYRHQNRILLYHRTDAGNHPVHLPFLIDECSIDGTDCIFSENKQCLFFCQSGHWHHHRFPDWFVCTAGISAIFCCQTHPGSAIHAYCRNLQADPDKGCRIHLLQTGREAGTAFLAEKLWRHTGYRQWHNIPADILMLCTDHTGYFPAPVLHER